MTPTELRVAAERQRRIAASRRRGADTLTSVSRAMSGRVDAVGSMSRAAWTGIAASGFEEMIEAEARKLGEVRTELRAAVHRLLADAERRLGEARVLEARAEAIEVAAVVGSPI